MCNFGNRTANQKQWLSSEVEWSATISGYMMLGITVYGLVYDIVMFEESKKRMMIKLDS